MSVPKNLRLPHSGGVEAVVYNGVVMVKNIIRASDGKDVDTGCVVYLNRNEVISLHEWFADLIENGDLWRHED